MASEKNATSVEDESIIESAEKRSYRILVYGIEQKGLNLPPDNITTSNYTLVFHDYINAPRFNEFDGVILFQGVFNGDKDEFDKRFNELQVMMKQSGFVCIILCQAYSSSKPDFLNAYVTDQNFTIEDLKQRISGVHTKQSEFKIFLDIYGASSTFFVQDSLSELKITEIASLNDIMTGFIAEGRFFFIPALLPYDIPDTIIEYFTLLSDGLISYWNKRHFAVPEWVDVFQFHNEPQLIGHKHELHEQITAIDAQLDEYKKYKRVLILNGDILVEEVAHLLKEVFQFLIDDTDEKKEDLKFLDNDGNIILLCEVKGTNKGVKRIDVYQAESHRERAGQPDDFPSILIMNTHIKNSRTVQDKDKPVETEQVDLATNHNVLILRTIDLLQLASQKLDSTLTSEDFLDLLKNESGWLKATETGYKIVKKYR